jgi:elongation factor Ts
VAEIDARVVKALREQTGAGMMDCKRALAETGGDVEKATRVLRERGLAKAGKREGRATSEGAIAISLSGGTGGMVELACETDFVARTDDFQALAASLARAVAGDASLDSAAALLEARVSGQPVRDAITAAIARLGENVVIKRVARLEVPGGLVGGYVHAGGKLGVLVGIAGSSASREAIAKDVAMHVAAADPSPVAVTRDGVSPALLASEREIYRKQAQTEGKPEKVIDRIVEGKLAKFVADICLVEQAFVKDPERSIGDLLEAAGGLEVTGFARFKLGQGSGEASAG